MVVWKAECEWDIGYNDTVWMNLDTLYKDVEDQLRILDLCSIEDTIHDLMQEGLVYVRKIEVIT